MNETFTNAWVVWVGIFLVVEGVAIAKGKGSGTSLTAHVREWFDLKEGGWNMKKTALLAFLLWLPLHFFNIWKF